MSPIHKNDDKTKLERLRTQMLGLIVVVVLILSATPVLVSTYLDQRIDEAQFQIACTSAQANLSQLRALQAVARELGIPGDFPVPEIPPECEMM